MKESSLIERNKKSRWARANDKAQKEECLEGSEATLYGLSMKLMFKKHAKCSSQRWIFQKGWGAYFMQKKIFATSLDTRQLINTIN